MRDLNRYEQPCCDCGQIVAAGAGRLYRLVGAAANGKYRRARRSRVTHAVYLVRCESCYAKHDKIDATQTEYAMPRSYATVIEGN